jgi:hypothetical protein
MFTLSLNLCKGENKEEHAKKARSKLPPNGTVLIFHWSGVSDTETGVKEFLYSFGPKNDEAELAEQVLAENGTINNKIFDEPSGLKYND